MTKTEFLKLLREPGRRVFVSVNYTTEDSRYMEISKAQAKGLVSDVPADDKLHVLCDQGDLLIG